ncbi:MAG: hypothetical protein HRF50_03015 [Phycisphaerae bacterium]
MNRVLFFGASLLLAGAWGCAAGGRGAASGARLFEGMGAHGRPVRTASAEAQRYFDQGLVWAYAFNHDEAIRSFRRAAELDSDCAMAWWGIALCNGPHINNPLVDDAHAAAAWAALQEATARMQNAEALEQALIRALAKRYADPQPADRRPLDEAYAAAMREVWLANRRDADVGTLFAEALMDLQPWDLWTRDGQPKGNTNEILAVLEEVLALAPDHPGANHLYVHAVEASPHPEKGVAAADRLRHLVPASGHLVHMPAHIDVQVGRWSLAADQNVAASEADRRYRALSPRQGFYRVYMAHNQHFLSFASMMEGRSAAAISAARDMVAAVPPEFIRENGPWIDPLMSITLDALKRFGRWDELLREPAPPDGLPITRAMWHFSRGLALAAKGQVSAAEQERELFAAAAKRVPAGAMMQVNPAEKILRIAQHMLDGEIAYRRGDVSAAVAELTRGVELEDTLVYMEPPEWIQPVRHTLGAVLASAGRFREAERVYRRDLEIWPENGWSLFGLAQSLAAQGQAAEAEQVRKRFEKAWARADTSIGSSCLCVPRVAHVNGDGCCALADASASAAADR